MTKRARIRGRVRQEEAKRIKKLLAEGRKLGDRVEKEAAPLFNLGKVHHVRFGKGAI